MDGAMSPISVRRATVIGNTPPNELPMEQRAVCLERTVEYLVSTTERSCRGFAEQMSIWKNTGIWSDFADSWEEFCSSKIERPAAWVDHVINGVELLKDANTEPTFEEAHDASVRATQAAAMKANPTLERKAGAPKGNSNAKNNRSHDYDCRQERGSDYLAQRIAETAPEIHQKMLAGEYTSTRAAAIDAGIVKPRQTFSVGPTTEAGAFAGQLFERLDQDFLVQVVAILNEALG